MIATEELFQAIESHRFSAIVNVASNFKTFLRALASQPELQRLAETMVEEDARKLVLQRILDLSGKEVEPDQEHPGDVAVAAYLWLLSVKDMGLASMAAQRVRESPRCWWAKKLAERIHSSPETRSDSGNGSSIITGTASLAPHTGQTHG